MQESLVGSILDEDMDKSMVFTFFDSLYGVQKYNNCCGNMIKYCDFICFIHIKFPMLFIICLFYC